MNQITYPTGHKIPLVTTSILTTSSVNSSYGRSIHSVKASLAIEATVNVHAEQAVVIRLDDPLHCHSQLP